MTSNDLKRAREVADRLMDYAQVSNDTINTKAASLLRSLCEIVEKLPKTADGVPVVPGDFVWASNGKWYSVPGVIGNGPIAVKSGLLTDATRIGDCYSSPDSPLAAAGKEKAPTPPTMPR